MSVAMTWLILFAGWLLLAFGIALICGRSFAAAGVKGGDQLTDDEFWPLVNDDGEFRPPN